MHSKAAYFNFKTNYMIPLSQVKLIGPPMELELEIDDTDAPTPFEAILDVARRARVIDQIFMIRFVGRDAKGIALVTVGVASQWGARHLTAQLWDMDPYDEMVESYIMSLAM